MSLGPSFCLVNLVVRLFEQRGADSAIVNGDSCAEESGGAELGLRYAELIYRQIEDRQLLIELRESP